MTIFRCSSSHTLLNGCSSGDLFILTRKPAQAKEIYTLMYHICFVCIYPFNGYRALYSFEEPCFMLVVTITSLARELNPTGVGEHIYCHPLTDWFVLSELFNVARQARFPNLGSKRQSKILPLSSEETSASEGICVYVCVCVCVCG